MSTTRYKIRLWEYDGEASVANAVTFDSFDEAQARFNDLRVSEEMPCVEFIKERIANGCIIGDEVLNVRQFTSVFDATSIANAVIALIAAIITAFVIPWIRSKTTAAQFEKIKMWVTVAVEAAEQLYTGSGRGAEKKAYVVEFLNSKGFKIDAETLDKLIEAAVFNLPDYFTISGIQADTDSNKE